MASRMASRVTLYAAFQFPKTFPFPPGTPEVTDSPSLDPREKPFRAPLRSPSLFNERLTASPLLLRRSQQCFVSRPLVPIGLA